MGSGNFARGFMETFPRAAEAASQRKQDAWEKLWKKYDENQEQFRKGEQESRAVEKKAKEYIATYDTEGKLPEGAEAVIANKIMSGFSDKQIQDLIQNGKWGVTDVPAGQVNPADEREQQQDVDQQTAGAMGLEAPQMAPEKPQGILGSVVAKGQDFVQQMALSPQEKAMKRFAQETGMTPDQVKQMMARGTMQQIPSAQERWDKASAGITAQLPAQTSPLDRNEVAKLRYNVSKDTEKEIQNYKTMANAVVGMHRDAKTMAEIAFRNPAALNEFTGAATNWIDYLDKTGKALVSVFGPETIQSRATNSIQQIRTEVENGNIDLAEAAARTEQFISLLENNRTGNNIQTTAIDSAILQGRKQSLAYKIAAIKGQDGRNLSETERKMFEAQAAAGNNPEKFMQAMGVLLEGELKSVEDYRKNNILSHGAFVGYKYATEEDYPGVNELVGPEVRDLISKDPELSGFYKDLYGGGKKQVQENPQVVRRPPPPPAAIEYLMKNPNLKDAFIQKYGVENLPQGF